ncbi:hypothetical protein [Actinomadura madurae]|nr:hypothetical protein [Actinomadura madurae]
MSRMSRPATALVVGRLTPSAACATSSTLAGRRCGTTRVTSV